jgi:hypothetical protein
VYVGNPILSVLSFSESLLISKKEGYGGVLLAISNQLTSTQITKAGTDLDLETNCENVWAKISYEGNKSLYLCTYYRPTLLFLGCQ